MKLLPPWAPALAVCVAAAVLPAAVQAAADRAEPGVASDVLKGQPPPAGQYDAVLCVTVGGAAPSCGPVRADIGNAGQVLVRVSDIAYRLEIYADQLGVTLFHGTMQIDGFFAPYRWHANQLQFNDTEQSTRYEVKLVTLRIDTP